MSSTGYILNGKYVRSSDVPVEAKVPRKQPLHKQYETDRELEEFRRDIVQPYLPNGKPNPEFIEAMPAAAERYGFVNKEDKN